MPVEIVSADHQNKPDIASSIARQWYDTEKVDAIMELTTSSVALAVQGLSKEKKKIDIVTGAATTDLTGKQCSPYGFHWAYDTHALAVGTGGALVKNGGNNWFFLTADYAFGYSPRGADLEIRQVEGRPGPRLGPPSARDHRLLVLPAPGPELRREGHRPRQCRPRHRQRHQAGAPSSASPRAARRLAALLFTLAEVHGLGLEAAQGLTLTEGWYWDQRRREPRVRQALHGAAPAACRT